MMSDNHQCTRLGASKPQTPDQHLFENEEDSIFMKIRRKPMNMVWTRECTCTFFRSKLNFNSGFGMPFFVLKVKKPCSRQPKKH